jgi:RHS repeat-associated protein
MRVREATNRLVVVVVLVFSVSAVAAGQVVLEDDKPAKYIMVLHEPAMRGAPKKVKEPDLTKHGGRVLRKMDRRLLIEVSKQAAKALRKDENVAYLQRVWQGESLDEWDERDAKAGLIQQSTSEDGSDLTWTTGTFSYDGSGNIKAMGSDRYAYDSVGRLIQAAVKGDVESYKYDSFGNLKELAIAGKTTTSVPIDSTTNRIAGETYDVAGNITTDKSRTGYVPVPDVNAAGLPTGYVYDSAGMANLAITPFFHPLRMIYTADDERIGSQVEGELIRWRFRDFNTGRVLREYRTTGLEALEWEEDYIYGESGVVAGERMWFYGERRHFHLDHLGSVRMITGDSRMRYGRHDYYPFGVEQTSSAQEVTNFGFYRPDPMKFAGHERDFNGYLNVDNTMYLDYMHARHYNPNLGRFLSVDPVLDIKQATKNPQGWNRYAYVLNNPLRFTDPTGRQVACANEPKDCRQDPPPPPPPPARKGTLTLGVTVQGTANTLSGSVTAAVNVDRQGEVAGSVTYGRGVTTNPAGGLVVGVTGSVTNANSVLSLAGKGTEASATAGRKLGITIGRVDGPQGNGTYSGGEVTIGAGVQTPAGTFQLTTTWMITRTQVMNGMTNVYAGTEQAAREWIMTSLPDYPD